MIFALFRLCYFANLCRHSPTNDSGAAYCSAAPFIAIRFLWGGGGVCYTRHSVKWELGLKE